MYKGRKIFLVAMVIIIVIITVILSIYINYNNQREIEENLQQRQSDFWRNTYNFVKETNDYSIKFQQIEGEITLEKLKQQFNLNEKDFYKIIKPGEYIYYHLNDDKSLIITVNNYSKVEMTVMQCIESGWWIMTDSDVNPNDLGSNLSEKNNIDYNHNFLEKPLLEEILEKLGGPTAIFLKSYSVSDHECQLYSIIYEYDEFVFIIDVEELLLDESSKSSITIPHISYSTQKNWEYEKVNYNTFTLVYEKNKR